MHSTMKKWGELEMKSSPKAKTEEDQLKLFMPQESPVIKEELSEETLLKIWHESFISEWYANRVEADFQRNIGATSIKHFYAWWKKEPREVIAIEKGFKIQLNESAERILTGRFDRVERTKEGLRIIDFKTGNIRDQKSVDADLQLSVYAMAAAQMWKEPVSELILLFCGEEGITERKTARNESQLHDAQTSMKHILERIEAEEYTPDPSYEKCKRCPYKTVCPAAAA